MSTFKVVFTPSGIRGDIKEGTDVLSAARELGADVASLCGGNGLCTRCKVKLSTGSFPKHQIESQTQHLSPITSAERERISEADLEQGYRLSCSAKIQGDIVIDVPAESQTHQQVIRKDATVLDIENKPAVKLITVDVEEPDLNSPTGDLERLKDAIEFETSLTDLSIETHLLRDLQPALRKGKWTVTVAIYENQRIIGIWSGKQEDAYGLAVDMGSTTIAGHLCHLATGEVLASHGIMNPQIRFGEDLMSRVSYSMMNPGGDLKMTAAIREGINHLVDQLLIEANTSPRSDDKPVSKDLLLDATFVGNPVMHHIFLGIDPVELGGAPFALATQASMTLPARDLDLHLAAGAQVYLPPCIAGHVGADAAAVVLSEAPYKNDAMTLIIDVGTNAEIILGNKKKLVAASSPTGPAFEGAQIHNGQRAAPGAIERVRIDPETLEPRYKVIGVDLWSDDPGFDEAIGETGVTGICGSGIIEAIATMYLAGIVTTDGVINGEKASISARIVNDGKTWAYKMVASKNDDSDINSARSETGVLITQNDIRAIQLAKGTLYASVQLLMDKIHVKKIEQIRFAGAFGAHIDPKYAMLLGMIPDCPLDQVQSVGNAAGTGARIALTNLAGRREIENEVLRMEKIETATEASFQDYFVNAMAIPHKIDTFEHLSQVVLLPAKEESSSDSPRLRRRRRSSRGGKPNISR
ncbi:ASKHA domain-containing protein [Cocleimonas sp. KMM 6892]|uniref:ASKHA domain-containing protein n=1 Tax=unclassified Cocleimonas TaxID=2639732 RepID=UPI002DBD8BC5|nr:MULTISPECIES: ASKHA domain-containing protein [unclassified Cocleimonas]MEB8433339.1 ASKHA domain-containing protein [Cocleimonas sp. KMM 6892]MEC4716150.1 ASKHA domain-containing protein [Cocleimonas sp. KMM 6895]MEC4745957.1 ASKHA domain-containing protein [Cocleimonas sp. KMM 6896]